MKRSTAVIVPWGLVALSLYCLIFVLGCKRPSPVVVYERVEVPVAVCPEPPSAPKPNLPIRYLTPDSTPEQVAAAYRETVLLLLEWGMKQETILNAYRPLKKVPKKP